jgi:hypothetical protein
MCKHCQIVVFHIILGNVHILIHYRQILFVHLYICPSPCRPFHCFANYSLPLCSPCSDFDQMLKGVEPGIIFWIFQWFFIILQVLSSMLESNMYSIIHSNVFSVTFGENFLFAIGVERFYNCKHAVEEHKLQLGNICANITN